MASQETNEPWQHLTRESLLVTPHLEVHREQVVRCDGLAAAYDIICLPHDAVIIVPTRDRRELLMIRQYRPAVRRESYEVPAGGMEPGESIEEAARRELREETGWDCPNVRVALSYHPMVGRSDARFHIVHAEEPVQVGEPTDPIEAQEVFWADEDRFAELWVGGGIVAGACVTSTLLAVGSGWLTWDFAALAGVLR
ncbi:MAG: NUDIX hydrolase [Phycisphaerae bacterium]|nr:NUDIX hydrolase [Phycisphaerae bacterium]